MTALEQGTVGSKRKTESQAWWWWYCGVHACNPSKQEVEDRKTGMEKPAWVTQGEHVRKKERWPARREWGREGGSVLPSESCLSIHIPKRLSRVRKVQVATFRAWSISLFYKLQMGRLRFRKLTLS